MVHRLGVLELEKEVVRDGNLRPDARAGDGLALDLTLRGVDQIGAAVIDEPVELQDVAPPFAEERGLVGESGRVPAKLSGQCVTTVPRKLGDRIAAYGPLASHDVLFRYDKASARPLPSDSEEYRRPRRDLLGAGHPPRELGESASGAGHARIGVIDA